MKIIDFLSIKADEVNDMNKCYSACVLIDKRVCN